MHKLHWTRYRIFWESDIGSTDIVCKGKEEADNTLFRLLNVSGVTYITLHKDFSKIITIKDERNYMVL